MDCQSSGVPGQDGKRASWAADRAICDLALDNIKQGLCVFDKDHRLVLFNRRYAEMFGIPPDALHFGTSLREVIRLRYAAGYGCDMHEDEYYEWCRRIERAGALKVVVVKLLNGSTYESTNQPRPEGGWVASMEDITPRLKQEEHIRYLAHHDALTGLANRVIFLERLQASASPSGRHLGAILYLDLDRFKAVNDSLGHAAGDLLLQQVAQRVTRYLRPADIFARLGGDEFAIILDSVTQAAEAAAIAERIAADIAVPFELNQHWAQIGVSIGIAIPPADGAFDPDLMMRGADTALYQAKAEGRGTYRIFEPGMDAMLHKRRAPMQGFRFRANEFAQGTGLVTARLRYRPARGQRFVPSPAHPAEPALTAEPALSPA